MGPILGKAARLSVGLTILLGSAAFCIVGLLGPVRPATVTGASGGGGASGSPVTSIDVQPAITPNPVKVGEMITVGGTVSIVGGPSQVKFTITMPTGDGGSYECSFETVLDENGVYGLLAPPFKMGGTPGTYAATIKAEAGTVSDTATISLTVNPA
jgi:hypothetical protein